MSIRERLSGNEAVSYAMKQINPDVVPVYPITPSTEIPQYFSSFVANGTVDTEFIPVESKFCYDEDHNNQNDWNYYGLDKKKNADKAIIDGIHKIMYDDDEKNTIYHVIRWNTANYVSKSADVAQTGNVAVENSLVAAAPLAPAVKGLNRNAVAVELKSAGDVKVSIVGVNGAVVANVAEKNLQAGVHQIKWNAGMAPNGRYIVKVEQNGMMNAMNVILK